MTAKRLKGLISIAGIIGVGKTTLADNLANELDGVVLYEQFKENPFLARQFSGCADAALPSELFFLLTRAHQLAVEHVEKSDLLITDYIMQKNRFFASMSLDDRQMAIYDEIESTVNRIVAVPDVVIYLYDTVENCLERISKRGREFERSISSKFLANLHSKYDQLFASWDVCPLIRIDCNTIDLRLAENAAIISEQIKGYIA